MQNMQGAAQHTPFAVPCGVARKSHVWLQTFVAKVHMQGNQICLQSNYAFFCSGEKDIAADIRCA